MQILAKSIRGPGGTKILPHVKLPSFPSTPTPCYYLEPGAKFANRFRIESHLAKGGMSEVFLAEDLENAGNKVVIKVVNEYGKVNQYKLDFLREERKLYQLLNNLKILSGNDARFPQYYGKAHGETESADGYSFIAMEYIPGLTLRSVIEGAQENGEKIPLYRAIEIAMQIAGLDALGTLHNAGYIHRDLKPDNVILNEKGAYLIDFGIACRRNYYNESAFAGTPSYMAPEQTDGEPLTSAADIYSLGLMLYEMINLKNPMQSESDAKTIQNHKEMPLPKFSFKEIKQRVKASHRRQFKKQAKELHRLLKNIILGMTEKDPHKRFEELEKIRPLMEKAHAIACDLSPYEDLRLEKKDESHPTWLDRLLDKLFPKQLSAEI